MLNGRCDACQYWRRRSEDLPLRPPGWGRCTAPAIYSGTLYADRDEVPQFALTAWEDVVQLLTAPDFGCAAWAARELS